jgi:aspartate racemase
MLIAHADVVRVLKAVGDGDLTGLAHYLSQLISQLADGGAEVAAISAITPHICIPKLLPLSALPLVDLIAETDHAIRAKRLKRVALFGTRISMETGLFGRLKDVELVRLKPDELSLVHDAYLQIVAAGQGSKEIFDELRTLAQRLRQRDGAEAIALAGTELSLVFNEANTDFPAIDCAHIHVEAIADQTCIP